MTPHKCPVCRNGRVYGGYETGTVPMKICPACKGTEVVWENTGATSSYNQAEMKLNIRLKEV